MRDPSSNEAVVSIEEVSKSYPGVLALDSVSLDLRAGEVHALIGENGAGKSTLIRVLSGDARPDRGATLVGGREVSFHSPADARRHGIATIFQELMIVPDMTVAENIVLGDEPGIGPMRQIYSRRRAERGCANVLNSLGQGSTINPNSLAGKLSTGHKQLIEIARALIQRAPVIVLDEPTAALSDNEAEVLLHILRQPRSEGAAILFVSHRLEEVRSIADRITVLRRGRYIATVLGSQVTDTSKLIELMVGSPIVASDVQGDGAVSSSHCNIGHELAKGAKALLPQGGSIAVLAGPPGASWASDRLRCFKQDISGSNIKIVAEQTSEQDVAAALSLANDFLQRFPKIDLMYGADDTYGIGVARAVQGAGKCGKVKVLFAVLGEQAKEMMRAGCVDYVVAQQPVLIGRLGVRMADDLIKGHQPKQKSIEVPLFAVTPANLDSIDKTTMQAPKGWTPGT